MTDKPKQRRTNNADRAAARAARDATEGAQPKIGRPTSFTSEVKGEILSRLEAGETLMKICSDLHLPADWSVRRYARTDPTFSADLSRARESWADAQADIIVSIADDSSNDWLEHSYGGKTTLKPDREAIDRSKLRIETRWRLMQRFNRNSYSDDAAKMTPDSSSAAADIKKDQIVIQPDEAGPKEPVL